MHTTNTKHHIPLASLLFVITIECRMISTNFYREKKSFKGQVATAYTCCIDVLLDDEKRTVEYWLIIIMICSVCRVSLKLRFPTVLAVCGT